MNVRDDRAAEHNAHQRSYFEAKANPRMVPRQTPYVRRQLAEVIRFAPLRPGDRVLDAGCGMGRHAIPLADMGFEVEGLELAPGLAEQVREFDGGRDRIRVHVADVASPPTELHGRYDAVVGFFMLHHLHDLPGAFRAMARLVRPGGRLAFLEPNGLNPLYYAQIAGTPGMTWRGDGGVRKMRRGPVFAAMREAGLVDLRLERYGFLPPFASNTRLGARLERGLERVPAWRAALPFQLFGARLPAA